MNDNRSIQWSVWNIKERSILKRRPGGTTLWEEVMWCSDMDEAQFTIGVYQSVEDLDIRLGRTNPAFSYSHTD